jgi:hypothetical protein
LWEGVEAFAIDPRHLGETFLRHLDSLKESNPVIRIAHDLFVVANAQGWWACDSAAEAAKLANRVGRHDPGQDPMSSPSTSGSEPAPEAASPGDVWSLGLEPAFENRMARIVAAACLAGRTPDLGRANLPAAAIGDLTHFVVTHVFDAAPLHRIKGCRPVLAASPEPNAERICEAIGNAMPQAWVSRLIWVSVHAAARAMALHARPGPIPDGSDLSQADYEQFSAMTTEQTRMILDCSTWIVHEALQSREGKIVSKQVDAAFAGIEMQNSAKG